MDKMRLTHGVVLTMMLGALMMLPSCSDTDEYYDVPDWISGSIYEELESYGNYSIFLKGVDIAGYTTIVNGKSILTVMAPDDDAMTEYLQETYGTPNIEEVDVDEVTKLIGYHILYYSFSKDMLTNFRPDEGDNATEEEKNVNGGLYYKFRTRSQDAPTYKNEATKDTLVWHYDRLLPIFSYKMFNTKGISAKNNYEYFYPETGWSGDDGFNVANANVVEYADVASNGYTYKVDRVIKPLETIYQEMKKNGNFTRFLSLYDKNEYYIADEDLTAEYWDAYGDSIYHHYYTGLPNIDCEWPTTNYQEISTMAMTAYSIFAPTDQAWLDFFEDYWALGGYESLDDVDSTQIQSILTNSIYSSSIVFPEEIENGDIESSDGELISFDTEEVDQDNRIICSNGVLYACNVLTPPMKFYSVLGPAYQYQKYSNFAWMIENSGWSTTLSSNSMDFIMFFPDNDQLLNNKNYYMYGGNLVDGNTTKLSTVSNSAEYVLAHVATVTDGVTTLPTSGNKVILCNSNNYKVYWFIKDGRITNSIKYISMVKFEGNTIEEDSIFYKFDQLAYKGDVDGWNNGHVYTYETGLLPGDYSDVNNSDFNTMVWQNRFDTTTDYYGWVNLMNTAGAINRSSYEPTFVSEECLMLVPTTEVVEQAIIDGKIPGIQALEGATVGSEEFFNYVEVTDSETLLEYLKLYYVPLSTATMSNYPYVGWGENTAESGGLVTYQQETSTEGIESTNINVYDDGTKLSVKLIDRETGAEGDAVDVYGGYDYFPLIYVDGVVYFLNGVF